jgi:DNA-binding winged helix-turn-helix (wHTH) protein
VRLAASLVRRAAVFLGFGAIGERIGAVCQPMLCLYRALLDRRSHAVHNALAGIWWQKPDFALIAWSMECTYTFGPFVLDPADRRLLRDGQPVEVSARYFDALTLLAAESGRLVTKERFHEEVWRGIPVTDEALTQCIRSLRRALDDDASSPRYIETVPRHGYRFIAQVEGSHMSTGGQRRHRPAARPIIQDALAGAVGGGLAGVIGALVYISAGLVTPAMGTASTLLVLTSINLLLGSLGGAVVGLGIGAMGRTGAGTLRMIIGGALGGLIIGAVARIIGNDLFELLFGRSPGAITGAGEGALLGLAVGSGLAIALRIPPDKAALRALAGIAAGGIAGLGIVLAQGKLMAGSLAELAQRFPGSRLGFDQAGGLFAAGNPLGLAVATITEAALFVGCVVGSLLIARRLRTTAD